jgi:hypothetical protein
VLKDHLLFYYKTHTDPSPKGEVPIQHCFVRRSDLKYGDQSPTKILIILE